MDWSIDLIDTLIFPLIDWLIDWKPLNEWNFVFPLKNLAVFWRVYGPLCWLGIFQKECRREFQSRRATRRDATVFVVWESLESLEREVRAEKMSHLWSTMCNQPDQVIITIIVHCSREREEGKNGEGKKATNCMHVFFDRHSTPCQENTWRPLEYTAIFSTHIFTGVNERRREEKMNEWTESERDEIKWGGRSSSILLFVEYLRKNI